MADTKQEAPLNELIERLDGVIKNARALGNQGANEITVLAFLGSVQRSIDALAASSFYVGTLDFGDKPVIDHGLPFQGEGPATIDTHVAYDEETIGFLLDEGFFDDFATDATRGRAMDAFHAVDGRPVKFEHRGDGRWIHAGGIEEILKGALKVALRV